MSITSQLIEQYLANMELRYSRLDEEDSWLIILDYKTDQFHLLVELYDEWLALTVDSLIDTVEPLSYARPSYHLCRLNQDVIMVKFFINHEGSVGLTIELPRTGVDKAILTTSIHFINKYIENEYDELKGLSIDPKAPSKYLSDEQ